MKKPFTSGLCQFRPNHVACKGVFTNGNLSRYPTVLCACDCHGDYDARMTDAGYTHHREDE